MQFRCTSAMKKVLENRLIQACCLLHRFSYGGDLSQIRIITLATDSSRRQLRQQDSPDIMPPMPWETWVHEGIASC